MLTFLSKNIYLLLFGVFVGFSSGYIAKDKLFSTRCPDLSCPECPPQTVLYINNEKIKAKNGGIIDLKSLLQSDIKNSSSDTSKKIGTTQKKRGFLGRVFNKK